MNSDIPSRSLSRFTDSVCHYLCSHKLKNECWDVKWDSRSGGGYSAHLLLLRPADSFSRSPRKAVGNAVTARQLSELWVTLDASRTGSEPLLLCIQWRCLRALSHRALGRWMRRSTCEEGNTPSAGVFVLWLITKVSGLYKILSEFQNGS